ncbi:MAG TPA: hypothetical protein VNQ79_21800 [Blastocatellia bacterium]|nr:hypothetical protein [Blastocatellia bacterium]
MRFLLSGSLCLLLAAPCIAQSHPSSKPMSPEEIRAFVEKAGAERKNITVRVRKRTIGRNEVIEIHLGKVSLINGVCFTLEEGVWLYGTFDKISWQDAASAGKRNPVQKALQNTVRGAGSAVIAPITCPMLWLATRE